MRGLLCCGSKQSMDTLIKMKIIADENVKLRLVKFLKENGFDVEYAPKGLRNSGLFSLALKRKSILLTHDKDFMNTILYPPKTSFGMIVVRIHPPELPKLKFSVLGLLKTLSASNSKGKLFIIKEKEVEIRSS